MLVAGPGFARAGAGCAEASVGTIRRVDVLSRGSNFELEIDSTQPVKPQTLVISSPDRLIVDLPYSVPGPSLRPLIVSTGAVKGIRVGLYKSKPPVTRVVVDLKSPQLYQVFPSGRAVIIKIMAKDNHTAAPPVSTPRGRERGAAGRGCETAASRGSRFPRWKTENLG